MEAEVAKVTQRPSRVTMLDQIANIESEQMAWAQVLMRGDYSAASDIRNRRPLCLEYKYDGGNCRKCPVAQDYDTLNCFRTEHTDVEHEFGLWTSAYVRLTDATEEGKTAREIYHRAVERWVRELDRIREKLVKETGKEQSND